MSHVVNRFDVKTDLRRAFMSSFSPKKFEDKNVAVFIDHAVKNMDLIKEKCGDRNFNKAKERIHKSLDKNMPLKKRREDLLTASVLI